MKGRSKLKCSITWHWIVLKKNVWYTFHLYQGIDSYYQRTSLQHFPKTISRLSLMNVLSSGITDFSDFIKPWRLYGVIFTKKLYCRSLSFMPSWIVWSKNQLSATFLSECLNIWQTSSCVLGNFSSISCQIHPLLEFIWWFNS